MLGRSGKKQTLYRERARSRNKSPQIYSRTTSIVPERNFSKLYYFFFIVCLISFLYLMILSPVLAIKEITVSGDAEEAAIRNLVVEEVGKSLFSKNILFFDSGSIRKKILKDLNIEDLEIKKKAPGKLVISAKKREASFLWEENEKRFLIDKKGLAFSDLSGEEGSGRPDLPKIKNNLISLNNLGDTVASKEFMEFIIFLSENFNSETTDQITLFEINGTNTEITVLTDKNYKVFFDATRNPASQLKGLAMVKEEALKGKKKLEYIDLRIETRVFYK